MSLELYVVREIQRIASILVGFVVQREIYSHSKGL